RVGIYLQSRNVPVVSPPQASLIASEPAALLPSFSTTPFPVNVPVQLRPLSTYFASNVTESPTVFPVTSAVAGDGDVKSIFAVKAPFAPGAAFAVPVYRDSCTTNSTVESPVRIALA